MKAGSVPGSSTSTQGYGESKHSGADSDEYELLNTMIYADSEKDLQGIQDALFALMKSANVKEGSFRENVMKSGLFAADVVADDCEQLWNSETIKTLPLRDCLTEEDAQYLHLLMYKYPVMPGKPPYKYPLTMINRAIEKVRTPEGIPEKVKPLIRGLVRVLNKIPYEEVEKVFIPDYCEEGSSRKVALSLGFSTVYTKIPQTKSGPSPFSRVCQLGSTRRKRIQAYLKDFGFDVHSRRDILVMLPGWLFALHPSKKEEDQVITELDIISCPACAQAPANVICNLGTAYMTCASCNHEDRARAVMLFMRGASLGDLSSIMKFGICFRLGLGIPADQARAEELFKRAAKIGCASAMVNLGLIYSSRTGNVKENPSKAVEMFKEAARRGSIGGVYNLGVCYALGYGVKKNIPKSRKLFCYAASKDNPAALLNMAILAVRRTDNNGQIMAQQCVKKAADVEDARGLLLLANSRLADGMVGEGMKLMQKGSLKHNPCAVCNLAAVQACEKFESYNLGNAISLWRQGAKAADMLCMYNLGICFQKGLGVPQNTECALDLFKRAANKGYLESYDRIIEVYEQMNDTANKEKYIKERQIFMLSGKRTSEYIR